MRCRCRGHTHRYHGSMAHLRRRARPEWREQAGFDVNVVVLVWGSEDSEIAAGESGRWFGGSAESGLPGQSRPELPPVLKDEQRKFRKSEGNLPLTKRCRNHNGLPETSPNGSHPCMEYLGTRSVTPGTTWTISQSQPLRRSL